RLLAGPGPRGQPLALQRGAQIVDLVPDNDPEIGVLVLCLGNAGPMGDGDLLHPLHPDGVVDVAEHVDVLGPGGQAHLEDGSFVQGAILSIDDALPADAGRSPPCRTKGEAEHGCYEARTCNGAEPGVAGASRTVLARSQAGG